MKLPRRQFLHLAAGAAVASAKPGFAWAETYPSRPIRLIVGFTPGAASDVVARVFANAAGPILGQQFVVENKPGAGGSIAGQFVARAANDGYTLFVPPLSTLTNELVSPTPSLDMSKDFAPVALLAGGPFVLVTDPGIKVHSVAELVALAKSKPGEVLYGSVGAGSLPHLCGELFARRAGLKLTHVPYAGSPQYVADLIAGRLAMSFVVASSVLGQISAGQLTALAITGNKRSSVLPNVPTMAEAGITDFDFSLWLGLLAPAGTPRPVVDILAAAAHKAMHSPEAAANLRAQGYEPLDAGPDEFGAIIRNEITRWSEVVRAAGLKT